MKQTAAFILTLILSVTAQARIADSYPISDSELWKAADVVAVVQIESGSIDLETWRYRVAGVVLLGLQGDTTTNLSFDTNKIFDDSPQSLGSLYLVHLKQTDQGYETLASGNAVIEIQVYPGGYTREKISEIVRGSGGDPSSLAFNQGRAFLPTACLSRELEFRCQRQSETFRYVSKLSGLEDGSGAPQ